MGGKAARARTASLLGGGSARRAQLVGRPTRGAAGVLGAGVVHELGVDRPGGVFPLAADVGQHSRDVLVAQLRQGRHGEVPGAAGNLDGAAEAVGDDAHEGVGLAQHPLAIDQGRSQAVEAEAVRLVAAGAEGVERDLALFE